MGPRITIFYGRAGRRCGNYVDCNEHQAKHASEQNRRGRARRRDEQGSKYHGTEGGLEAAVATTLHPSRKRLTQDWPDVRLPAQRAQ